MSVCADGAEQVVRLHVIVPASVHSQLRDAADANGISLSDLCRLLFRAFLRGRFSEAERELLR